MALEEQVRGASEGADAHDDGRPDQLGQETDAIERHQMHQAEQVERNQEQEAEQDRDQHNSGYKTFHARTVPNLTAPAQACGRQP
jgi:hypothetical protein